MDADGNAESARSYVESLLEMKDVRVIVVSPAIEAWLLPTAEDPHRELRRIHKETADASLLRTAERLVEEVDIAHLRESSSTFSQYYEFVVANSLAVSLAMTRNVQQK